MARISSVFAALSVCAAAAPTTMPASAQPPKRTMVGALTCDIAGGIGMIIASRKGVACMFTPATPGPRELYVGTIGKFGLDVGTTAGGAMVWAVYAPTQRGFGALAGRYGGPTAEATLGAGVSANALIGGSNRTVMLQPLSVQGQAGLNLAIGVAALELVAAR